MLSLSRQLAERDSFTMPAAIIYVRHAQLKIRRIIYRYWRGIATAARCLPVMRRIITRFIYQFQRITAGQFQPLREDITYFAEASSL